MPAAGERTGTENQPAAYDPRYGETDLDETSLKWRWATYILLIIGAAAGIVCLGTAALAGTRLLAVISAPAGGPALTPTAGGAALATNTARPTVFLPTVTDAPPTRTPTPSPTPSETPGPCLQQVQPGDSLIAIVARCGHRDLAVIDLVLELNNLSAPEVIQSGQTLEIPWPTPTDDPASAATETPEGAASAAEPVSVVIGAPQADSDTLARLAAAPPTATLQPGVTWHRVASGENIIIVAYTYGANVKILSELNPEITFSQCDFGLETGGPNCVVQIYEGQLVRVPAPTPTPTLSPTPSGRETPTATPTYAPPVILSPPQDAVVPPGVFRLEWVSTGVLLPDEVYLVQVEDATAGTTFAAITRDTAFLLPDTLVPADGQPHAMQWAVSVARRNEQGRYAIISGPPAVRRFQWQSR